MPTITKVSEKDKSNAVFMRTVLGMKRKDVAEIMGVSPSLIRIWVNNAKNPPPHPVHSFEVKRAASEAFIKGMNGMDICRDLNINRGTLLSWKNNYLAGEFDF